MSYFEKSQLKMKPGFCCVEVRIPHMVMPHYRQCSRKATTTGPINIAGEIGPVCGFHSPEAKAKRRKRSDETMRRNMDRYTTYLRVKGKL